MSQALSLWQFSELLIILNLDFMIIRMSELDSENGHSDLTLYCVSCYFPSHLHAVKADWEVSQIFEGEEDKNKFSLTSHF